MATSGFTAALSPGGQAKDLCWLMISVGLISN